MSQSVYNDIVIEKKLESILNTKLNLNQFLTVDNELAENSGMTKRIVKYDDTGDVQDLAMGVGNTSTVEIQSKYEDYVVGTTQGRFSIYDEEAMMDDRAYEAGMNKLADKMVNAWNNKAIAEFEKAVFQQGYSSLSFDTVVDAIAKMNLEDESGFSLLIAPEMQAAFRKAMGTSLQYSGDFQRTGYIGHVCGLPVFLCKALEGHTAYVVSPKAVTLFMKKGTEVEQYREPNTRQTTNYIRKVALVALTDARYIVKIAQNPTAATVTTKAAGAKTIAGTCAAGSTVTVYVKGKLEGNATVSGTSWTIDAAANLVANDAIKVVVKKAGYIDSVVETVAA